MDTKIALKQSQTITDKAFRLVVTTETEAIIATEFLSKSNVLLDKIIEEEEKITGPINAALKAAREPWALPKKTLKETILLIRGKLSSYQTASMRASEEESRLIASKLEQGKIKISTALKKMEAVEVPAEKVSALTGSLTFRPKQVLKITNESLIPRKYLVPDEEVILEHLKAGSIIAGCEIEIIQIPINRR
jgi:hypothetical protein